jgi:hypothetical protein
LRRSLRKSSKSLPGQNTREIAYRSRCLVSLIRFLQGADVRFQRPAVFPFGLQLYLELLDQAFEPHHLDFGSRVFAAVPIPDHGR